MVLHEGLAGGEELLPWGDAYVSISNVLPPGHPRDAYVEIWPLPPKLANLTPTAAVDRDERP